MKSRQRRAAEPRDIRTPFAHPELEVVSPRALRLISSGHLTTYEQGMLVKQERALRKLDVPLMLQLQGKSLPSVAARPLYPIIGGLHLSETLNKAVGWVRRFAEYVTRIEESYWLDNWQPPHLGEIWVDDDQRGGE